MKNLMILGLAAVLALAGAAPASDPPNIVFILADDMGYGDVHALNPASTIATPHLDALAQGGMTFSDAHTPSAVCTPTRYGLLTGRYCWRSRLKRGVLNGYSPRLIEEGRATVAAMLGSAGYQSAVIGKWHLGLGWAGKGRKIDFTKPVQDSPNALGFDTSYIIPASLDFPPYVYVHDGRVTEPRTVEQPAQGFPAFLRKGPRARDLIMDEVLDHLCGQATAYIRGRAASAAPFFLYLALSAPHKPVLPHPRFRGRSKLGDYGDFIIQVDWVVGQVRDALASAGLSEKTLLFFSSDNGSYMYRLDDPTARDHVADSKIQAYRADHHRPNGPWRGTKADIWEGGHHVPFFAVWPGHVKPGSRCERTICLTDFMATCAQVSGAAIPPGAAEDSYGLAPLLAGRDAGWQRPPVIHHSVGGMFAIREGRWKLVAGNGSGGRERPRGKPFAKPYQLFDMSADPGERHDLIAEEPEVAQRLAAALEEIRSSGRSVKR